MMEFVRKATIFGGVVLLVILGAEGVPAERRLIKRSGYYMGEPGNYDVYAQDDYIPLHDGMDYDDDDYIHDRYNDEAYAQDDHVAMYEGMDYYDPQYHNLADDYLDDSHHNKAYAQAEHVAIHGGMDYYDPTYYYPEGEYDDIEGEKYQDDTYPDLGMYDDISDVIGAVSKGVDELLHLGGKMARNTAYKGLRIAAQKAGFIAVPEFGLGGIVGGVAGDFVASKVIFGGASIGQYESIQNLDKPESLIAFCYGAWDDAKPLKEIEDFVDLFVQGEIDAAQLEVMEKALNTTVLVAKKVTGKYQHEFEAVLHTIIRACLIQVEGYLKVSNLVFSGSVPTAEQIDAKIVKLIIKAFQRLAKMQPKDIENSIA